MFIKVISYNLEGALVQVNNGEITKDLKMEFDEEGNLFSHTSNMVMHEKLKRNLIEVMEEIKTKVNDSIKVEVFWDC